MHCFGIPRHTQSMKILVTPVQNCIVGMLLPCHNKLANLAYSWVSLIRLIDIYIGAWREPHPQYRWEVCYCHVIGSAAGLFISVFMCRWAWSVRHLQAITPDYWLSVKQKRKMIKESQESKEQSNRNFTVLNNATYTGKIELSKEVLGGRIMDHDQRSSYVYQGTSNHEK